MQTDKNKTMAWALAISLAAFVVVTVILVVELGSHKTPRVRTNRVSIPAVYPLFSVLTPDNKTHQPFAFFRSNKLTVVDVGYDMVRINDYSGKSVDIPIKKYMDWHYKWAVKLAK